MYQPKLQAAFRDTAAHRLAVSEENSGKNSLLSQGRLSTGRFC